MATPTATLFLLAIVAGLASFASAQLSRWHMRHGRGTLGLAGSGIGTALLLTAVFLVVFGVVLIAYQWFAHLDP